MTDKDQDQQQRGGDHGGRQDSGGQPNKYDTDMKKDARRDQGDRKEERR